MSDLVRAAIYARYSSHAQGEQSIEAQISEGRKYAEKKGYTVVKEYIDRAQSGRTDNRAAFQSMLADLPKKAFTVLILWKIDRFGRNREEIAINKHRCKKHGVRPEYIAESIPDTPEGVILEAVLEGFAEYYSLQLSQNVKRGRRASAEKCKSVGSPPPYGYRVGEDKRYVLDPDTSRVARSVYDQYLNGGSMAQIATGLNRSGIRTRTGREFTVESIRKILSNERYTGMYILGDIRIDGGMPQIVAREEWDRVQDIMERNKKSPNHKWSRADFLLTGKVFCGCCGSVVTGASGRGRNGAKHDYYACQGHRKRHNCGALPWPKSAVEESVLEVINDLLDDEDLVAWIADQTVAVLEEENRKIDKSASIKKRMGEIDVGIANLLRVIESGVSSSTIISRLKDLETERDGLKEDLAVEEATQLMRITRDHIIHFIHQIRDGRSDSRESHQKLIDVFVSRVELSGGSMTIRLNYSAESATITKPLQAEPDRLSRPVVHHTSTGRTSTVAVSLINGSPFILIRTKK